MNKKGLIVACLGICLVDVAARGQDSNTYSSNYNWSKRPVDAVYDPGLRTYTPARPNTSTRTDAVLKAGPIQMRSDVGTRLSYDDNISLSERNRRDDIIITPYANFGFQWPLTDVNTLNLTVGIYRDFYLFNPGESTEAIGISPKSALEFWIYAGEHVRFVLFDHFALEDDAVEETTLNDTLGFYRFTNTAGITGYWDVNESLTLSLGYRYHTVISLADDFDFLDRDTHSVDTSLSYKLGPETVIGGFANAGWTFYDTGVNNDSLVSTFGVFGETRFTDYIHGNASISYSLGDFDSGGTNGDGSGLDEFSINGILSHRLNQVMSHSIGAGRATRLGTTSNFFTTYYARHSADWQVIRDVSLGTNLFFEFTDESNSANSEHFIRWGGGIRAMYRINSNLTTGVNYQYAEKDSNRANRDYFNNRVSLDVNYRF
ncbi:MAG: outer membrane beta-barrel protein [Verrucomicrobiota bacterium]